MGKREGVSGSGEKARNSPGPPGGAIQMEASVSAFFNNFAIKQLVRSYNLIMSSVQINVILVN